MRFTSRMTRWPVSLFRMKSRKSNAAFGCGAFFASALTLLEADNGLEIGPFDRRAAALSRKPFPGCEYWARADLRLRQ